MKKLLFIMFTFFLIFISCKKNYKETSLPNLTKEEISGAKLWERITKEDNYKKYPQWPTHEGKQPGKSPHGRYHKIFINPKLRNALPIKDKITPIGTIVVKENYTPDNELDAFTVMAKVEGYDPENNDWFWAKYDKDGNVAVEGKFPMCISCHIGSNNDYLIVHKLDKPLK